MVHEVPVFRPKPLTHLMSSQGHISLCTGGGQFVRSVSRSVAG